MGARLRNGTSRSRCAYYTQYHGTRLVLIIIIIIIIIIITLGNEFTRIQFTRTTGLKYSWIQLLWRHLNKNRNPKVVVTRHVQTMIIILSQNNYRASGALKSVPRPRRRYRWWRSSHKLPNESQILGLCFYHKNILKEWSFMTYKKMYLFKKQNI